MIPYWSNGRAVLWQGHVLDCLAAMEAQSVHCAVTSPPYWGLRDYDLPSLEWPPVSYAPMAGLPPLDIPGCDPECEHVWVTENRVGQTGGDGSTSSLNVKRDDDGTFHPESKAHPQSKVIASQYCQLCGGWRGCLGLEPTPEMFVGHIVLVARELWRVLRDDGTFWLNFGDSYNNRSISRPSSHQGGLGFESEHLSTSWADLTKQGNTRGSLKGGLKEKDLIGIPWRVAFALQADGWYLRSDIIWAKGVSFCPTYSGSCMPESVRDRPTKGHEYVFLLTKNKRYFYDGDAVREAHASIEYYKKAQGQNLDCQSGKWETFDPRMEGKRAVDTGMTLSKRYKAQGIPGNPAGRNLRTVWTINPGSYAGAHFATFPPALVEPMIKAGTSQRGCCPECGTSWVRVTEKSGETPRNKMKQLGPAKIAQSPGRPATISANQGLNFAGGHGNGIRPVTTIGWTPTCSCDAGEPVPCTVLDPFLGSGTTVEVADFLGRHSVGIELSQKYCDDHIIPRLTEPLFEWAVQEQQEPEPEIEQLGLL